MTQPERARAAWQQLPLESKNYMTAAGLEKLKKELRYLLEEDRPQIVITVTWAAKNGDRSENADYQYGKKRLREIDKRVRYLTKRIENAEVVQHSTAPELVFFGASVCILRETGEEQTLRIVGVDEIDLSQGWVSWLSPIAKALFKAREGDVIRLPLEGRVEEIEVLSISY